MTLDISIRAVDLPFYSRRPRLQIGRISKRAIHKFWKSDGSMYRVWQSLRHPMPVEAWNPICNSNSNAVCRNLAVIERVSEKKRKSYHYEPKNCMTWRMMRNECWVCNRWAWRQRAIDLLRVCYKLRSRLGVNHWLVSTWNWPGGAILWKDQLPDAFYV
jgi:hypothetical protein